MLRKTKRKIIITLAVALAAGSVIMAAGKTAAARYSGSFSQNINAEKLFYCETDQDYVGTCDL